jgi:nitrile hydratase beta subunit
MDGIHDLGGQSGHSTLGYHRNEPVFKDRWEATVFTMVRASAQAGAYTNIDQFRHAVERIDPKAYLEHGYYGRWLGAVETLFVEAGILTTAEITERAAQLGAGPDDLIAARPSRTKIQATGIPAKRNPVGDPPWFKVGDPVHTVQASPLGHTRLPGYARNKEGLITACQGLWPYPDLRAHGHGEQSQYLYTVTFKSLDLGFSEAFELNLDLFEPYLSLIETIL